MQKHQQEALAEGLLAADVAEEEAKTAEMAAAAEQEATRKKQVHSSTFKAPVVSSAKPVVST